jgi:hypothetical protein
MQIPRRLPVVASTAIVGLAFGVAAAVADTSDTDHPGAQRITADGVGAVELGATHRSLHERGLVGKLHHGCELGGPSTRQAKLKGALEGIVDYTLNNPRRAANITLTEGGAAHGVGIGDSIKDIKQEFPRAKVNHGTDRTFRLTLVTIPKKHSNKTRYTFGVSTKSHHVKVIGIPFVAICD